MSHFAKIEDGIVVDVIVAEQDFIDSGAVGDPSAWVQTSYNTRGGIHYDPVTGLPSSDQSKALRKNYACIGSPYDAELDAFLPPKEYNSWILNTQTCLYEAPIPHPDDELHSYSWDEQNQQWHQGPTLSTGTIPVTEL
jgi:hypothetical protein